MTAAEFRSIRISLGLSTAQLAAVLGYASGQHVTVFESSRASARATPPLLARLMAAYAAGYRPADWPFSETDR